MLKASWLASATMVVTMVAAAPGRASAAEPPALARARALYNAADFEGAISAAAVAQRQAEAADAAALVSARAHLEQYRRAADPADLSTARDTLGSIRAAALTPRDHVDLLIGLGQSLYLSDMFGAAAELFDTALGRSGLLNEHDRLMLLDWWATTLDREAQTRPPDRRASLFEQIATRMENELRDDPGSAPASYWLAVAARGMGDSERAWTSAVAGWVRSRLNPETSDGLRADLDRLATQALVLERARSRSGGRETPEAVAAARAEWDLVKAQWK